MKTLHQRLLSYLAKRPGQWVSGLHLGQLAYNCERHYKPDTASRVLRRMAETGEIQSEEKKTKNGVRCVFYRYVNTKPKPVIIERDGKRIAVLIN